MLAKLNALVHVPVIDQLFWHIWWIIVLCFTPLVQVGLVISAVWHLFKSDTRRLSPHSRAVLITGCDSGFGHSSALRLDSAGWKVYAACLTEQGMNDLRAVASENLVAFLLDITKEEDIQAAKELIGREAPNSLHALVNNAGIAIGSFVDLTDMEAYRLSMEVNFFGPVALTKAMLPFLKRTRGRVINMTSIAGLLSGAPNMSTYAASKHAMEAFTDSLRQELTVWGVSVHVLNPSFHRTPLVTSFAEKTEQVWAKLPQTKKLEYGRKFVDDLVAQFGQQIDALTWDPKHVTDAIEHAVTATSPKVRYLVGLDAKTIMMVGQKAPSKLQDWIIRLGNKQVIPAALLDDDSSTPSSAKTSSKRRL